MSYRQRITEGIESFPEPEKLRNILRMRVLLDSKYNVEYSQSFANMDVNGVEVSYFRLYDGGGNDWYAVFLTDGSCLVFGYDNESDEASTEETQPVFRGLPEKFVPLLSAAELSWDTQVYATVALWWDADEESWDYSQLSLANSYEFDDGGFEYFFKDIIDFNVDEFAESYVNQYTVEDDVDEVSREIRDILRK